MRGRVGYIDALKILGADRSKALDVIDRLLGGAILVATAAAAQPGLLALLSVRDEIVSQTAKMLTGLGQRVRGARGKDRTDLLVAAHAVVAVNAYFKALRSVHMPIDVANLKLTPEDEVALAGSPREAQSRRLFDMLIRTGLPLPTPYRPYEQNLLEMRVQYLEISRRLVEFVTGLAVWDQLNHTKQAEFRKAVETIPPAAIKHYEEGFRQLAADCPEFSTWMSLTDSAASRAAIKRVESGFKTGLADLQAILESLKSGCSASEWPTRLNNAYQAQLDRHIAETSRSEALAGLTIPTIRTGYVTPRFRVAQYDADTRPAEDWWWERVMDCPDISWFLAGYLTSPATTEVPLVILGQPGSGKSLLTKMLAASLPPEEYLPVRVELRHVPADAPMQDQIEAALRDATGDHMEWPELVRQAGDVLPVVMLDGFDELLQSTGISHSDYLEQVRDFQRREAAQGRRVAVIVTSRTVVANRVRFPEGTAIARMEPFNRDQISQWLMNWNNANVTYLRQSGLDPLPIEAVLAHLDLAEQPLLLLMLSFYDADGNALQHQVDQLGRAELYEGLLAKFVDREIDKLYPELDDMGRRARMNRELHQLSVVAFAMFNRGRKSVTEQQLDADLKQLIPEDSQVSGASGQMALGLSRSQMAVARFFFIHRSEAQLNDTRLNEYEFLHATFGEYLVARLICNTVMRLVKLSEADTPGLPLRSSAEPADDDLWDLLSFAPLSDGSQTIGFLAELVGHLPENEADGLRGILRMLFLASLRSHQGYGEYEPRRLDVPARHATYNANLLILNVLAASDPLRASTLFSAQDQAVDAWRRLALLWRSQLDPAGWDGLINTMEIIRAPDGDISDLIIRRRRLHLDKPLEYFRTVNWLASQQVNGQAGEQLAQTGITVEKTARQAAFLCAPELDLLVHALEPLLQRAPSAFGDLFPGSDGAHNSILHAIVVALVAGVSKFSNRNESARFAQQLPMRSTASDINTYITDLPPGAGETYTLAALANTPPVETGIRPTVFYFGGSGSTSASWINASSTGENSSLAAIQLHLAHRAGYKQVLKPFSELPSLEQAYSDIDPTELARADAAFIAQVFDLAHDNNFAEWAGFQGLIVLALLPVSKLKEIRGDDVKYVISNSHRSNTLLMTIIDRYNSMTQHISELS